MTRAEWELCHCENEPFPPFRLMTWPERALVYLILWPVLLVFGLGMFVGILALFAAVIDGAAQRNMDHDRCLKTATNGYEIRACH